MNIYHEYISTALLSQQIVPSTHMEVLVSTSKQQDFHKWFQGSYQPLEEPQQIVAAPRRATTNHMYNESCHWASEQGIDLLGPPAAQIATFLLSLFDTFGLLPQGYRSCLTSILSHTLRAAVVQDRIIFGMMSSLESQRPRLMPILPEWDLGIVLDVFRKPPYEPLWEVSLKHLT